MPYGCWSDPESDIAQRRRLAIGLVIASDSFSVQQQGDVKAGLLWKTSRSWAIAVGLTSEPKSSREYI